jgi:hypothetical protein
MLSSKLLSVYWFVWQIWWETISSSVTRRNKQKTWLCLSQRWTRNRITLIVWQAAKESNWAHIWRDSCCGRFELTLVPRYREGISRRKHSFETGNNVLQIHSPLAIVIPIRHHAFSDCQLSIGFDMGKGGSRWKHKTDDPHEWRVSWATIGLGLRRWCSSKLYEQNLWGVHSLLQFIVHNRLPFNVTVHFHGIEYV